MECSLVLAEEDEELGCVFLTWRTAVEGDHSAITVEEQNNRTELYVDEWF